MVFFEALSTILQIKTGLIGALNNDLQFQLQVLEACQSLQHHYEVTKVNLFSHSGFQKTNEGFMRFNLCCLRSWHTGAGAKQALNSCLKKTMQYDASHLVSYIGKFPQSPSSHFQIEKSLPDQYLHKRLQKQHHLLVMSLREACNFIQKA